MVKTIEDCVEGNAKFAKLSDKGHHYCPKDVEPDCYNASDNNNAEDDQGNSRPICRLKVELSKDLPDVKDNFLLLYRKR